MDSFRSPVSENQQSITPSVHLSFRPLPEDARRSLAIYNLVFPLAFLALLPGYVLRMLRRGGYREKFSQRLGRFNPADRERLASGDWTWIHSISVGETLLALKLARKIRDLDGSRRVILSVTTSTGFAVAQTAASEWLEVIYNPLDLRSIVRRTLSLVRPRQIIFIEAIWPNLLAEAKRRGVPTSFVPRLSPRSARRFQKFAAYVGPIFRLIDKFAVTDFTEIARWQSLGVPPDRIAVTGNSKFDHASEPAKQVENFRYLLRTCGVSEHAPILLGGSTFPGEERILAEVVGNLRAEYPELFLILVPRHVERTDEILRDLHRFSLRIALRTSLSDAREPSPPQQPVSSLTPAPRPDLLLVNTTGELRDWYHLATVVFIGKSLSSRGGQNPVEAVMAGKPVVFGPHMENFEPIVSQWLAADAAIRVTDTTSLRREIARLLRDPDRRKCLAARARALALPHEGATDRTAEFLLGTMPPAIVDS